MSTEKEMMERPLFLLPLKDGKVALCLADGTIAGYQTHISMEVSSDNMTRVTATFVVAGWWEPPQ